MMRFLLSWSLTLVMFGPLFVLISTRDSSTWQAAGAFMLMMGLGLMDFKISRLETTVAKQGAVIDDLRRLAVAHHPGLEFSTDEEA
jgi:hypothetical protein